MRKIIFILLSIIFLINVISLVEGATYNPICIWEPPNFEKNNNTIDNSCGATNTSIFGIYGNGVSGKFPDKMTTNITATQQGLRNTSMPKTCNSTNPCSVIFWYCAEQNRADDYLIEWRSGLGQYYFTTDSASATANYDLCNADTNFFLNDGKCEFIGWELNISAGKGYLWVNATQIANVSCNTANGNPNDTTVGTTFRGGATEDVIGSYGRIVFLNTSINETIFKDWNYSLGAPDTTPPSITFYNMTSSGGCGVWNTNKSAPCTTEDTTPTVNLTTDEAAYCRIGISDVNYTTMGNVRNCTSGETTTSHICTLIQADALTALDTNIFISCRDLNENENLTSTSGALKMNITPANEAVGDTEIESGVNSSLISGATILSNQQIYIRTLTNSQTLSRFDKVAISGNQRWAFNYVSLNETTSQFTNMANITPSFYVLEMANRTSTNVSREVSGFINATKQ